MRIGDPLTVIAPPGSFKVKVVGIATFTTTNPGAALVYLDPGPPHAQLLGSADKAATSISVDAARGVERRGARSSAWPPRSATGTYEVQTADEQASRRPRRWADSSTSSST